jgi:hypothetical protein
VAFFTGVLGDASHGGELPRCDGKSNFLSLDGRGKVRVT